MTWDLSKHPRGTHGRFAASGALKVIRSPQSRIGKHAGSTLRNRVPESTARARWTAATNMGKAVKADLKVVKLGKPTILPLSHYLDPSTREWHSHHMARTLARHKTSSRLPNRHTTKRTAMGHAYVVRGAGWYFDKTGAEHVHKPGAPKRNLAGKKGTSRRAVVMRKLSAPKPYVGRRRAEP